eukprot:4417865-Amphidinium_carterae.1
MVEGFVPLRLGRLRRLVGKMLLPRVQDSVTSHLHPIQLGVGTPMGCEAVAHTVRQWRGRNANHATKALAQVDLSNALNEIDRAAFRGAVRRVCPGLTPFVDMCYGSPSNLRLQNQCIHSARGVQQGDPLGPVLYALGMHPA